MLLGESVLKSNAAESIRAFVSFNAWISTSVNVFTESDAVVVGATGVESLVAVAVLFPRLTASAFLPVSVFADAISWEGVDSGSAAEVVSSDTSDKTSIADSSVSTASGFLDSICFLGDSFGDSAWYFFDEFGARNIYFFFFRSYF